MRLLLLALLAACGPSLQAMGPRHVIVALDHQSLQQECDVLCAPILEPGERALRCDRQDFGWPEIKASGKPPTPDRTLDMKKVLGDAVGIAVCKVGS
jgi:hypothetical protein